VVLEKYEAFEIDDEGRGNGYFHPFLHGVFFCGIMGKKPER